MAAVTKASIVIGSGTGAAGSSRSAPGYTGSWVDVTSVNGGVLGGRIKNNGAVGVAGTLLWQWSPEPTAGTPKIYDLWQFGGDMTSGSDITVSTRLDKEIKFVRMLGYGNTTSSVLFESDLAASS